MAETLSLAVNVATVIDLFIKVGVQCSEYCAGVKAAPREVRSILNEADRLGATLKEVTRLLNGPNGPGVEASQSIHGCVEDCRLQLELLAVKLKQGRASSLKWPFRKGEVAEIITKIERCRSSISLDLQIHQATQLASIHHEIILKKLRIVERARFDAHSDADNARCYPGTRIGLIKQALAWVDSDNSKSIFWLNGMAGTGKSTIARTISQELADTNKLGASFFFKRGEGDRGRAAFFFPTIAAQIARQLPSLAPLVRCEVEADPSINHKALNNQFDSLIVKPVKKLPKPTQRQTLAIVVDALDECDDLNDVKRIIYLLSQVKDLSHIGVKAFVTSRPELPIQLGFDDISGEYRDLVLQEMPRPIIENDITVFLKHELAGIRLDYNKARPNRPLPPSWPGPEKIQRLVEMAIPLFIVAATVCRFMKDRRIGGPRDQLERILERQRDQKSRLDATYLPVLDRLFAGLSELAKKEVITRFKKVVGSIVILETPLSSCSLARLLGIPVDTIEDQLDYLHSVLRIPPDSNEPVQLLHLSFRDFLIDPEKCGNPEEFPFWIEEHQTHFQLAIDCLRLLSAKNVLKQDICNLKHPGTSRAEVARQTIQACVLPEVQYACRYWTFHWKASKQKIQDGDQVHQFLNLHLLHWFEILCLLGNMSEIQLMINGLIESLHVSNSCEVGSFLRDAERVMLGYGSAFDSWPLQIYYIVTVFAPHQSIVRKTFGHLFPTWISSPQRVESSWGERLAMLEGHRDLIHTITFSPDSSWLASGSRDYTIKLWHARTSILRATLKGHHSCILVVAFSPDSSQIASVSFNGIVKLWDTTTGACIATFELNFSTNRATISPDLNWLSWSGLREPTVQLWKIGSSHDIVLLEGHRGAITAISFSADSSRLASGSEDGAINLWDIETGINLATFKGHGGWVTDIKFSPNSHWLASGSNDTTLKLWDAKLGACVSTLEESHSGNINVVAFSPNSKWLASASKTIKLWDIETGVRIATYIIPANTSSTIAFSPDSDRLALGSVNGNIELWDTTQAYSKTLENHSSHIRVVEISPDSRWLATLSSDGTIRLWDMTGTCIQVFEHYEGYNPGVKFSPDSKWLILGPYDSALKIWDIAGADGVTLQSNCFKDSCFSLSPDSKWLASGSRVDGAVTLWDVETGACLATIQGHSKRISAIEISLNSKWGASGSEDGTVMLWDKTGARIATLMEHRRAITAIKISPDSKWLASASNDHTIKLWDMAGLCTAILEGHSEPINSLAISSDSKWLASGSIDSTINLRDTATSICAATITQFRLSPEHFQFSADNSRIYTSRAAFAPAEYCLSPSRSAPSIDLHAERWDIGVSVDGTWITCNSRNVLWLPPPYWPRETQRSLSHQAHMMNSVFAFACHYGGVFVISFNPPMPFES
ncbi:unnamed protein product [Clonostachys rosea]|uniref:Mitochondrial division protein 1 n=1 Tax=Bionectria ochroleuca TaxID=29856 RepID=A0ABY6UQW2_BIOOC|nr:unnamed protein product [Clonostachys rosea]